MKNYSSYADTQLRILKNLPDEGDLSLIILKGHLLIEELLFALVSSAAKHPSAIESGRLHYHQLASVAKALYYEEHLGPVWDAIFELNTLRNELAHQLEPKDLGKKLKKFGVKGSKGNTSAGDLVLSNPAVVVGNSIAAMCGVLIALIETARSIKLHNNLSGQAV